MKNTNRSRIFKSLISILLLASMLLGFAACSAKKSEDGKKEHADKDGTLPGSKPSIIVDLIANIDQSETEIDGCETDETFIKAQNELAVRIFKEVYKKSSKENLLISPLSITLATMLLANGAEGETLDELESLFGEELSAQELNEYLYTYMKHLTASEKVALESANSAWFNAAKDISVNEDYLKILRDYYGADAYESFFGNELENNVNQWISEKTHGLIDEMGEPYDGDSVFFLVNALYFNAKWKRVLYTESTKPRNFTSADGTVSQVDTMYSAFEDQFILDDAKGIIKKYADPNFAFVAILPNEDISIDDYVNSLSSDTVKNIFDNKSIFDAEVYIPKFSYNFNTSIRDVLNALGVNDVFEKNADLSALGSRDSNELYVTDAMHQTTITINECGTVAGSTTKYESFDAAPLFSISFNRPFVYMIVDCENQIPLFIGTFCNA